MTIHDVASGHRLAGGEYGYTPQSRGELERIVRMLHEYYPRRTLNECRELLALMFGHASWLELDTATLCGEPAAYDEDEAAPRVALRRSHQHRVLLAHFGAVSAEQIAACGRDADRPVAGAQSIAWRHDPLRRRQRIERARCAHNVLYARHALEDIRPSARERRLISEDDDTIHLSLRVELLPRALQRWIIHQCPRLRRIADHLAAVRIRQHAPCDLLNFAFLWGEICVDHPTEIPEPLQVYPLVACAKWYAWNTCAQLVAGHLRSLPVRGAVLPKLASGIDPTAEPQRDLLLAQPREDVADMSATARERALDLGHRYLKAALEETALRSIHRLMVRADRVPAMLRA